MRTVKMATTSKQQAATCIISVYNISYIDNI
jgi:hypothetical protein